MTLNRIDTVWWGISKQSHFQDFVFNPDEIVDVDREICFDAICYQQQWFSTTQQAKSKSYLNERLFETILERCIDGRVIYQPYRHKPVQTSAKWVYAIAACLIAGFCLWFFAFQSVLMPTRVSYQSSATVNHAAVRAPLIAHAIPVDRSIVEINRRAIIPSQPIVIPEQSSGVIQLASSTGILAEAGCRLSVRTHNDSNAAVVLSGGTALFVVKHGAWNSFVVTTPHAAITVTGTVFKVMVSIDSTVVTMLQGTVVITSGTTTISLSADGKNNVASCSPDSLVLSLIASGSLRPRSLLLSSYLSSIDNKEFEFTFDTLFAGQAEERYLQTMAQLNATTDRAVQSDLFVIKTALSLNDSRSRNEAAQLLIGLYRGTHNADIKNIALYLYTKCAGLLIDRRDEQIALIREQFAHDPFSPYNRAVLLAVVRQLFDHQQDSLAMEGLALYRTFFKQDSLVAAIAFFEAQVLRTRFEMYGKAADVYDVVYTDFPHSPYAGDALYWSSWCTVQSAQKRHIKALISTTPEYESADVLKKQP